MLTLTITLKSSAKQIELAFDSRNSMHQKARCLMVPGSQSAEDDYGHVVFLRGEDVDSIEEIDLDQHWSFRGKVSIIKLRAEAKFRLDIEQQPDLRPYVAPVSPKFGG